MSTSRPDPVDGFLLFAAAGVSANAPRPQVASAFAAVDAVATGLQADTRPDTLRACTRNEYDVPAVRPVRRYRFAVALRVTSFEVANPLVEYWTMNVSASHAVLT